MFSSGACKDLTMPMHKFKTPASRKIDRLITWKNSRLKGASDEPRKYTSVDERIAAPSRGIVHVVSKSRISSDRLYISRLKASKRFFVLSRANFYAVADCDLFGKLTKNYCILERLIFTDGTKSNSLFVCSCDNGTVRRKRLSAMSRHIRKDAFNDFVLRNKENTCIHLKHIENLFPDDGHISDEDGKSADDETAIIVDELSSTPLRIAVFVEGRGYGSVQKGTKHLRCTTCSTSRGHFNCEHVKAYKNWYKQQGVDIDK